jgi:3-dehydrosphinganine reductase
MTIKARLEPGKVALVTGGSSGIGKCIACGLAERGLHVWLVAQRKDMLESARKEVEAHRKDPTQQVGIVSADVCEVNEVRSAVNYICEKSGSPDLLVNSAGVAHPGYVEKLDINIYDWMMDVNYFGTVYMTKEVIPAMIKRGSGYIVNISSGAGLISYFGYTAYSASKFAVRGFTDALRQELKPLGIGVSIVYPSDTDTPQLEYENHYKPFETNALSGTAGSMMSPDQVAREVLRGIEHGKYQILNGLELKLFYRINGLSEGLVRFAIDQMICGAQKKKNSTHPPQE